MMNDDELQRAIENNEPTGESADARAYKKIMHVLSQETYHLPASFADRVARTASAKNNFIREHFWMAIGVICLVTTGIVTAVVLRISLNFGAFKFLSGYPGLVIFGVGCVVAFHWAEKKFVQKNIVS